MYNFTKLFLLIFAIFHCQYLFSQINYVNLNPDKVLQHTAYDSIDFNSDGISDMKFTQEDSISSQNANGVGVTLMHYDIEFVGLAPSYDPSHFYTYKLDSNIFIDNNAGGQLWVTKLGANDVVRIMQMYFYNVPYHLGEWVNGVIDGFLGIRIKINGDWHYGWIRMDVDTDAHKLTIKDFAYNSIPYQGIYTGQKAKFKHKYIEVTHDYYDCGNIIIYKRDSIPNLNYDKICRLNSQGNLDSIGAIYFPATTYFKDNDTNIIFDNHKYSIIPVTFNNIKGESDTVSSIYADLHSDSLGNIVLSWTPYKNLGFSYYEINKINNTNGSISLIDSVPKYLNSYMIPSQYIDSINNEFYISLIPYAHIFTGGYLEIASNLANINPSLQIHPKAGFFAKQINILNVHNYQFYDTSAANINQWHWDFGDGDTSNIKKPQHSFAEGVYTVSLIVSNCYGTDSIIMQNYIEVIASLSTNSKSKLSVFPNPSQAIVYIKNDRPIMDIKLFSIDGKEVLILNNINKPNVKINTLEYDDGLYFMEIILDNDERIIKKIILKK